MEKTKDLLNKIKTLEDKNKELATANKVMKAAINQTATTLVNQVLPALNVDSNSKKENWFIEKGQQLEDVSIESIPILVGLADAADLLGWDRRKVSAYYPRPKGDFPKPVQTISSGPVWTKKQIEDYKATLK